MALRLSLDAEPILGCSFNNKKFPYFWERCKDLDEVNLCKIVKTDKPDSATQKFYAEPIDPYKGPMITALLVSWKKDRLSVKVNHLVMDGPALREYIKLLGEIYSELLIDSEYKPQPNVKCNRSIDQVMQKFNVIQKIKAFIEFKKIKKEWVSPKKYWAYPGVSGKKRLYQNQKISPEVFKNMQKYSKENHVSINDILLTLLLRSMYELHTPEPDVPLRVLTTINLRRHLLENKTGALSNIAGYLYVNLGTKIGDSFEDTLKIVRNKIHSYKKKFLGIGDFLLLPKLFKILPVSILNKIIVKFLYHDVQQNEYCYPVTFSNAGVVDVDVDFGKAKILHTEIPAVLLFPPFFSLGFYTSNNNLIYSSSFCTDDVKKSSVTILSEKLFENMDKQFK